MRHSGDLRKTSSFVNAQISINKYLCKYGHIFYKIMLLANNIIVNITVQVAGNIYWPISYLIVDMI